MRLLSFCYYTVTSQAITTLTCWRSWYFLTDQFFVPNCLVGRHATVSLLIQPEMEPGLLYLSILRIDHSFSFLWKFATLRAKLIINCILQLTQGMELEQMLWCCWCVQLPRCWLVQDCEENPHSWCISWYPHYIGLCDWCWKHGSDCWCRLEWGGYCLCP